MVENKNLNTFLSLTLKNTTFILLISLQYFIINKKNYFLNNLIIKKNYNSFINISFLLFFLIIKLLFYIYLYKLHHQYF